MIESNLVLVCHIENRCAIHLLTTCHYTLTSIQTVSDFAIAATDDSGRLLAVVLQLIKGLATCSLSINVDVFAFFGGVLVEFKHLALAPAQSFFLD